VIHQNTFRKPLFLSILAWLSLALLLLVVLTNVAAPAQVVSATTTRIIDVDNVDDDKPGDGCTLREAIDLANSGAGAGEHPNGCIITESVGSPSTPIVYEINLPSYTYTLSGAAGNNDNSSGDLDISANVIINGAQATISGGGIDRVFHIDPTGIGGVTVSISSLVIQEGYVAFGNNGGGIYNNSGTLYIADSTLSGNYAGILGGGIYNQGGTVYIADSTLSGNQADVLGGGIYNKGILDITGSTILNNTSTEGGGIRVFASIGGNATATLSNSAVISNTAGDSGGGGIEVWASPDSTVTVTLDNSTISHNHSDGDGGGIRVWANESTATVTLDNSTISGNDAGGDGGGIYNQGGTVNATDSTFSDNRAGLLGGGIQVFASIGGSATAMLSNSAVISNTAGDSGGGIEVRADPDSAVTVTLGNIVISHNHSAGDGGGIQVWASESTATVALDNSTLSGNDADGNGGGVHVSGGIVNLNNATITDNTADADNSGDGDGGGIRIASGAVNIKNTIVAGNHDKSGTGAEDCSISGALNSQGYNLVGNGAGCPGDGVGDQSTADPRLGPLANNGGDTQTHCLLFGSPAIDAAGCTDLSGVLVTADQRGASRPVDGNGDGAAVCDVGAYEAVPLSISKTVTPTIDVAYHGIVTYTVLLNNSDLVDATDVLLTDTLPAQLDFVRWIKQPDGAAESDDKITWNGNVAVNNVVTFTFVVTHTGDYGDIVTNTAEYSHTIGSGSADATFIVESMNFIYMPLVLRDM
jgi:uncharacterized repeat protein (TIGR01451 family)/CSLREA domain-containing protein